MHKSLAVRITDARIVRAVRDASRELPHWDVASAHRDGRELVLLAPDGTELAGERSGCRGPASPRHSPLMATAGNRRIRSAGPGTGWVLGTAGQPSEGGP
ncbi:hypothetical protein HXP48_21095 [Actinospica acidiphila]|uniref:YqeB family protein n=1 Tax=Actinospica acidiphila TaxID=304899 RepID=UPI00193ED7FF|nr:hypothetical protein [Actinospica acidiphila]MBM4830641.1 hypothetical protein [Actinospica acidiphila]